MMRFPDIEQMKPVEALAWYTRQVKQVVGVCSEDARKTRRELYEWKEQVLNPYLEKALESPMPQVYVVKFRAGKYRGHVHVFGQPRDKVESEAKRMIHERYMKCMPGMGEIEILDVVPK